MADETTNKTSPTWLSWVAPLVLSLAVSGVGGYGGAQFASGEQSKELQTVVAKTVTLETRIEEAKREHKDLPSREEFRLILEDLKEIKTDLRELRQDLKRK